MSSSIERLATHLSVISESTPIQKIEWPAELDRDAWFMSPELLSLYGTDVWNELDESARKPLVSGLAQRIYSLGYNTVSPYIHHFLGEENRHMEYFGRFCRTYAGKIYP